MKSTPLTHMAGINVKGIRLSEWNLAQVIKYSDSIYDSLEKTTL